MLPAGPGRALCRRQARLSFADRHHFYAVAAAIMRQVTAYAARMAGDFLKLNQAIDKLKLWDERKCRVVELRYFAGLTTVKRDLTIAEALLRRELA